jgi:hypothetical protein
VNWEALGAIANLVAALGVIATLIYLAIQIRQNSKQLQGNITPEEVSRITGNRCERRLTPQSSTH